MFTPRKMFLVIVSVFLILTLSSSGVFMVNTLESKFYPARNKTLVGLVSSPDRENVEKISFIINNFSLQFAAFAVVTICTIIIVVNLRKRREWLKSFQFPCNQNYLIAV